ncbi:uncharacterized protein LOC132210778 [Stegostoma tigrinum]|uniref:uncharacterized protein LOC132210778 n=1 Tax=Stegostoma tigrinum TaxID=3053191 RepID=UPI00286FBF70|nr:uncharacterized protein LOC132210778 [Stegostoma tigrinum]
MVWSLLLAALFGSVSPEQYRADVNMAGIQGTVQFNSSSRNIQIALEADCEQFIISVHEFPVRYGNFRDPCNESNIGERVYSLTADKTESVVTDSSLFQNRTDLSDLSVTIEGCRNATKACATVRKVGSTSTWQGKFFSSVAGDVYIRQNAGEETSRILTDLMAISQGDLGVMNVTLLLQGGTESCSLAPDSTVPNTGTLLGTFKVGTPLAPIKSRRDGVNLTDRTPTQFLYMYDGSQWFCTEVQELKAKEACAYVDMKGVRGTFKFHQVSPFDGTSYTVSLKNLRQLAGPYHVHNFPVPPRRTPGDQLCANDNLGGHWNPFGKVPSGPSYPQDANETHDQYEVGDLSKRHGFLTGRDTFENTFKDWNLPLFGRNSIVGRSVVIHHPNSSRWLCATIEHLSEVTTAVAVFTRPVSGRIIFQQQKNDPYSDLSIFMDLSYTNSSARITTNHLWRVHEYPISSELDSDSNICLSTKGNFNPFRVDTGGQYDTECGPDSPFRCEAGDYAEKHGALKLSSDNSAVYSKHFFTDTTSALAGQLSIVPRAVVLYEANSATSLLACANITFLHPTSLEMDSRGVDQLGVNVTFKQVSDLDRTIVQVTLTDRNHGAGAYSIHTLPIQAGLSDTGACSDSRVGGRYNPFHVNESLSPEPLRGTVDQYEVGDISGKFGTLDSWNQTTEEYMDRNLPLFGPRSVVRRSLVIYHTNGSRLQCANLLPVKATDGEFIEARAVFNGTVLGTIILSQQVFADGSSSDTTMEIDLQPAKPNSGGINNLMWHVHTNPRQYNENCTGVGGHYNPYNVDTKARYNLSCSSAYPLHCEVGDLESKQGLLDLGKRHLKNDVYLPLHGDFTIVGRSVVIHSEGPVKALMDCTNIVADSPTKLLVFPKVDPFNRYEFRRTVADVLGISVWRVNILPGGPSAASAKGCQQITFYVAGHVDQSKLNKLDNDENLGKFKASAKCTTDPSGVAPGLLPYVERFIFWILTLTMQLVLYSLFE